MSEEGCQGFVRTEGHTGLSEIVSRLRCELQRVELSGPDPAERRGPLPEVRRGGEGIDIGRLRRSQLPDKET